MPDARETCPRCGGGLVRGQTPAHKVCLDCPACGGRAVTLPVLREAIGAAGIASLTRAARLHEHAGCVCPACGGNMSLLRLGLSDGHVEIDVCPSCLTVWCDKGEFDCIVPAVERPRTEARPMKELVAKASPEAQRRFQETLAAATPTMGTELSDYDLDEVLLDVVRLFAGLPSLWRKARPVTPILSILIVCALPVVHAVFYYLYRDIGTVAGRFGRCWSIWPLHEAMVAQVGFSPTDLASYFTYPFVQASCNSALVYAALAFTICSVVEVRHGHRRFACLALALWFVSLLAQVLATGWGIASGRMCGALPLLLGITAYALRAFPDVQCRMLVKGTRAPMSIVGALVGAVFLASQFLHFSFREYTSLAVLPTLACLVLGACFGRRRPARRLISVPDITRLSNR